ncbi:MAG: PTS transporter subunit EIIC [Veillonella sp.]|uniref:PTS transporter subunit EIIC n=1 Tax=Veillonella sp. TaxID=1926307 RepID=UPI0025CB9D8B|nr:PTS transporter subunit EIIC [Veillonella sp.]MBS4913095.1 PTS transporter subunit EIIC [Veillonella sp.]
MSQAASLGWFKRSVNATMDLLSSLFLPIIALLVSTGILKGIFILLTVNQLVDANSSTYTILHAMSDGFFYFLPVFLAYTAAKRFGVDPFTAILLACVILYPDLTNLLKNGENADFFGLPVLPVMYPASVIPILLAVYGMKFVEILCKRIIPASVQGLFTPPVCIAIMAPVTLMLLGPLGKLVGDWLGIAYEVMYNVSPLIAGIVIGVVQPFIGILGLQWGFFPIAINNVAVYGFDTLMPLFGSAMFAQAGASLAVAVRSKNKLFRSEALSASITALLGVTEPAVFGVTLRLKRPMVCACIAGGIGGAVAGFFKVSAAAFAIPAVTTLPVFVGPSFVWYLTALGLAFTISFILTLVTGFEDVKDEPVGE